MSSTDQALEQFDQSHGDASSGQSPASIFWLCCLLPTIPLTLQYLYTTTEPYFWLVALLASAVTVFLFLTRRDGTFQFPKGKLAWLLLLSVFFLTLISAVLHEGWWSALAMVILIGLAFGTVRGKLQRRMTSAVAPMVCLLHAPFGLNEWMVAWIDRKSTWFSSIFLDRLEIPHSTSGAVVRLFESEILTREVNAGLLSVFTVLLMAYSFMAWKRMSLVLIPLFFLVAIFTTIVVNTIRIVAHVVAQSSFEADLSAGWAPLLMTGTGMLLALGIVYSFTHLIALAFHYIEGSEEAGINPFLYVWNGISWMSTNRAAEEMLAVNARDSSRSTPKMATGLRSALIALSGVLLVVCAVQAARAPEATDNQAVSQEPFFEPSPGIFKSSASVSEFADFDIQPAQEAPIAEPAKQGAFQSKSWVGTFGDAKLTFQVTQAFDGWREISVGYARLGWEILDRNVARPAGEVGGGDETEEGSQSFATLRMRTTKPETLEGYVFFTAIDEDGNLITAPTSSSSIANRVWRRVGMSENTSGRRAAMFQLMILSPTRLSPSQIKKMQAAFVEARQLLMKEIAGQNSQDETPDDSDDSSA